MNRVELDLVADRHAHFLQDFQFVGLDLSAATLKMQIRLYPEQPGTPLATISQSNLASPGIGIRYAATNTVANHIAAGWLDAVPSDLKSTDQVFVSVVGVWWPFASTMPQPAERGADMVLYYDVLVNRDTSPTILPMILMGGRLTIRSGVTV